MGNIYGQGFNVIWYGEGLKLNQFLTAPEFRMFVLGSYFLIEGIIRGEVKDTGC